MTEHFFVYGTLKRAFHNNYLLENETFVEEGITVDDYIVEGQGFPRAYRVADNKGFKLVGDVYKVSEKTIETLDYLESNGSFYNRSKRLVMMPKLETVENCWIYETMGNRSQLFQKKETKETLIDWDYDFVFTKYFRIADSSFLPMGRESFEA